MCVHARWCSPHHGLVLYVKVKELWSNRTWIDFRFLYSFWQDPTIDPYLQGSVSVSPNSVWFHTAALCAGLIPCCQYSPGGGSHHYKVMTYVLSHSHRNIYGTISACLRMTNGPFVLSGWTDERSPCKCCEKLAIPKTHFSSSFPRTPSSHVATIWVIGPNSQNDRGQTVDKLYRDNIMLW